MIHRRVSIWTCSIISTFGLHLFGATKIGIHSLDTQKTTMNYCFVTLFLLVVLTVIECIHFLHFDTARCYELVEKVVIRLYVLDAAQVQS